MAGGSAFSAVILTNALSAQPARPYESRLADIGRLAQSLGWRWSDVLSTDWRKQWHQ